MMIREAAARYEVSRAKLHRLISLGRLSTEKDPRDERATLVNIDDLEALFRFPVQRPVETEVRTYAEMDKESGTGAGLLTADMRARVDELRSRISGGRVFADDSADIIREEREKRSRELDEAAFGQAGGSQR